MLAVTTQSPADKEGVNVQEDQACSVYVYCSKVWRNRPTTFLIPPLRMQG